MVPVFVGNSEGPELFALNRNSIFINERETGCLSALDRISRSDENRLQTNVLIF